MSAPREEAAGVVDMARRAAWYGSNEENREDEDETGKESRTGKNEEDARATR